jgi:hypothetical protein
MRFVHEPRRGHETAIQCNPSLELIPVNWNSGTRFNVGARYLCPGIVGNGDAPSRSIMARRLRRISYLVPPPPMHFWRISRLPNPVYINSHFRGRRAWRIGS